MISILDTGPLVALLNENDDFHGWAAALLEPLPRAITAEAVLVEAAYLLRHQPRGLEALHQVIGGGDIIPVFRIVDHRVRVSRYLRKYKDLPGSVADICLLCLSEDNPGSRLITIDQHFRIFKRHDGTSVPCELPPGR